MFADTLYSSEDRFQFNVPITFFEKAGAEEGFRRRIGGLVSTQAQDQEGETVLQRGLDFDYFLNKGFYNDNHDKKQTGVLGYPDLCDYVTKGQRLPDNTIAPSDGHWAEGYLLEGWEPADKIWALGQALKKTGNRRRLGFSIEGTIQRRAGPGRKIIAKARVKNVAITHCPVNVETGLSILAKSLLKAEEEEEVERALSVGTPTPGAAPTGPRTGAGAGQILTRESLEQEIKPTTYTKKRSLSKGQAVAWVLTHFPQISAGSAGRFVDAVAAGRI